MAKVPTRSPTDEPIAPSRIASMGLELEDLVADDVVDLDALIALAEDRGRPASHYLAALALATDAQLRGPADLTICVGNCQQWGALDLADHVLARSPRPRLAVLSCLDQCDRAPACKVGPLVVAPATAASLDEALAAIA